MSKVICRKAINFDRDTNELKKHYPGKNYRNAYTDIKNSWKNQALNIVNCLAMYRKIRYLYRKLLL